MIRAVEAAAALALAPLLAHVLFSWIGFNPTDDGFVLAGARRILEGQIPHRDFISIRPAGSFLLHAPEVWLGGERVILLSRAVFWFEIAAGAWGWTLLLEWARGRPFAPGTRLAVAGYGFALNAHIFPAMAWHSVDAATLAAAGLALAARSAGWGKLAGYAVLGLSPLCRQNFLPMVPLGVLLLGDRRRPWCWAAAFFPISIYVAVISALGGWHDLRVQLGARVDLLEPGVLAFVRLRETWVGLAAGALAAGLAGWRRDGALRAAASRLGAVVAGAIVFAGAASLWNGSLQAGTAFFLWGAALGVAAAGTVSGRVRAAGLWLAPAAGWCGAVSFGYNTPVLLAGALAGVPLALAIAALEDARSRAAGWLAVPAAVLALGALAHARPLHVYRDLPAVALGEDLGAVLPGGRGIRTNANTARFMASLGEAVSRCGSRPYAVVPDCAAWWVRGASVNPLPGDWLSNTEISEPDLFIRVVKALEAGRGRRYVILQKVRSDSIAWERRPLRDLVTYAIADYVRKAFRKTGETGDFEIYY
ncbi:MAG: hypothetical protein AAB152_13135 [Candidatus Coatesbacteria bacterium]